MSNFAETGPALAVYATVAVIATGIGGLAEFLFGFEGGLRIGLIAAGTTLALVSHRRRHPQ